MEDKTSRRRFLQFVAGGAVAVPLGITACDSGDTGESAPGSGTPTATASPSKTPVGPPTEPLDPATPATQETWIEPWVWRPHEWPGQQLELNIVENQNPGPIVGFGNASAVLFSYNGATPGPTIRMKGDETLFVRLRNVLGLDQGSTYVGPFPDLAGGARPPYFSASTPMAKATARAEALGEVAQPRVDFCLGEHANGVHSLHVTNLHTHGLHVRPGRNPDGTHSDNVILRLMNQPDFRRREASADSAACEFLRDPAQVGFLLEDEQVGYADYEIRLGNVQAKEMERLGRPPQPHPPGTHWYHPHSHGATHNQVASGMAGFLIVEGDVDEAINHALTGDRNPDPQVKTGRYGYIERVMFIQRVSALTNPSKDSDSGPNSNLQQTSSSAGGQTRQGVFAAINGDQRPRTITMRPGDVERWRVLNGSVDGRGYKRFQVLRGDFAVQEGPQGASQLTRWNGEEYVAVTRQETEDAKHQLFQLAFDGVTLIEESAGRATYTIKDLAGQNPNTTNPLNRAVTGDEPNVLMAGNIAACFADPKAVKDCYVRPNEVYMAPANRTDVFFRPTEPGVYTVLAQSVIMHGDNYEAGVQSDAGKERRGEVDGTSTLRSAPEDIVVAYVVVQGNRRADEIDAMPDREDGQDIDLDSVLDLIDVLPPVPPYLQPITDGEVRVKEGDPDERFHLGDYRTRTITYSGWGSADSPLVTTIDTGDPHSFQNPQMARRFRAFVDDDRKLGDDKSLEDLRYTKMMEPDGQPDADGKQKYKPLMHDGEEQWVLLPAQIRTMAITGSTGDEVVPGGVVPARRGRKFGPSDPQRPQMLAGTAEEWVLNNDSIQLWANTNPNEQPIGRFQGHYSAVPLTRSEGRELNESDSYWQIATKAVDHPFHIHQNPCWVTRIEIPDENGNLVNILDAPRWQDVMWIPRNAGRVVFRSRFPDFVGAYVEHCHILLHEDNGMMQVIEVTPFADQANYDPKDSVAGADGDDDYERHSLARAWEQSMQFYDPNHSTGQDYPGFEVSRPEF